MDYDNYLTSISLKEQNKRFHLIEGLMCIAKHNIRIKIEIKQINNQNMNLTKKK